MIICFVILLQYVEWLTAIFLKKNNDKNYYIIYHNNILIINSYMKYNNLPFLQKDNKNNSIIKILFCLTHKYN